MKKMIKELMKIYTRRGFRFEIRKKHIVAIHQDTKKRVTIGKTPSDYRAYKNTCKYLEHAMVGIECK